MKTKKQIEEELSSMILERDRWYKKYNEIDEEKKRKDNNFMLGLKEENNELKYQVKNLLEIIRWHINPDTAKSPFMASKEQRDDMSRNHNGIY